MSEVTQSSTKLDPQDIARVATAEWVTDVNKYLDLGWVIIGMASSQHSEHGFSLTYHLGWPRKLGEPQQPEKSGWSTLFTSDDAESKDGEQEQSPF
jgi:hypothetical protein